MAISSAKAAYLREARDFFRRSAWQQRACAVSGDMRDWADGLKNWEAHHVVEARELKRLGRRELLWDERNALRLTPTVHRRHTNRMEPVPQRCLTDSNIEFAFEVLGVLAKDYLDRLYTGTDSRIERASQVVEAEYALKMKTAGSI